MVCNDVFEQEGKTNKGKSPGTMWEYTFCVNWSGVR